MLLHPVAVMEMLPHRPHPVGLGRGGSERRRRRAFVTSLTSDEVSNVTSGEAPRDCGEQLYTFVNGVTGEVEGDISFYTMPAVHVITMDALLELDEMSVAEFGEALRAGDLAAVFLVRPEEAFSSSSVVSDTVLGDNKKAISATS
ncbi:hypothetical protein PInf_004253 [Phytophthora infestans]|nr:hypothetical protein PInf_004253 [Phytophthora infestans]